MFALFAFGACGPVDDDPTNGDGDMGGDAGDGDGDAGDGDGDAGDGDGDAGDGDGDMGGGGGMGGGPSATCDFDGFPSVGPDGSATEDTDKLIYADSAVSSGAGAVLFTEIYYSLDAPSTTYETSDWEPYETCSTCVQILDCPDVDDINYDDCTTYEVYEGTLEVTENDDDSTGPFAAILTNAKAREVTVDSDTLVSTPVEDGAIWCIDSYTIDVTTEAP